MPSSSKNGDQNTLQSIHHRAGPSRTRTQPGPPSGPAGGVAPSHGGRTPSQAGTTQSSDDSEAADSNSPLSLSGLGPGNEDTAGVTPGRRRPRRTVGPGGTCHWQLGRTRTADRDARSLHRHHDRPTLEALLPMQRAAVAVDLPPSNYSAAMTLHPDPDRHRTRSGKLVPSAPPVACTVWL